MARDPSPAEIRTRLDPAAVDVVADQLHDLLCVRLLDTQPPTTITAEHREADWAKARFILLGLRQAGWSIQLAA